MRAELAGLKVGLGALASKLDARADRHEQRLDTLAESVSALSRSVALLEQSRDQYTSTHARSSDRRFKISLVIIGGIVTTVCGAVTAATVTLIRMGL